MNDKRQILIEQLRQKRDTTYLEIARHGELLKEYKRTHWFSYRWAKFWAALRGHEIQFEPEIDIERQHWEYTRINETITDLRRQIELDEMLETIPE
jgi:hypothetical protein